MSTATVPVVVDENAPENVVVERFMEASRDLVPHVQVSLAKRIVKRGSNQVVWNSRAQGIKAKKTTPKALKKVSVAPKPMNAPAGSAKPVLATPPRRSAASDSTPKQRAQRRNGAPSMRSGFVPPPPPNSFSLPSMYEYAPFNLAVVQPTAQPAGQRLERSYSATSKPEVKTLPRSLDLPSTAAPTAQAPVQSPKPAPVNVETPRYEPIQLERIQTVNGIAPLAVPLPGNGPPPLRLERLTP